MGLNSSTFIWPSSIIKGGNLDSTHQASPVHPKIGLGNR